MLKKFLKTLRTLDYYLSLAISGPKQIEQCDICGKDLVEGKPGEFWCPNTPWAPESIRRKK